MNTAPDKHNSKKIGTGDNSRIDPKEPRIVASAALKRPLHRPKAILFDWDNTLVDTFPVIIQGLRDTFVAMGMEPWSDHDILTNREGIHHSLRDSFPRIFGEQWEHARELYYQSFLANHLKFLKELPGAADTLTMLGGTDIFIGIVSNKTGKYLRVEVEHLGWNAHFKTTVGATDAEKDKPFAEPVHLALKGTGIGCDEQVWLIGDSATDVNCAINAGITPIVFGEHIFDMVQDEAEKEAIRQMHAAKNHSVLRQLIQEIL